MDIKSKLEEYQDYLFETNDILKSIPSVIRDLIGKIRK